LQGRRIHWSGYTSSTDSLEIAKEFAKQGGVIMEINISNGKLISDYSFVQQEHEILLSPNMGFYVYEETVRDGEFFVLKLVQERVANTFVF